MGDAAETKARKKNEAEMLLKQTGTFKAVWQPTLGRVVVLLSREFTLTQWPEIEALFQQQAGLGRHQWRFDTSDLVLINSRLMGQLIGLNTILSMREGALELVVAAESGIAHSVKQARLDRILTVIEK